MPNGAENHGCSYLMNPGETRPFWVIGFLLELQSLSRTQASIRELQIQRRGFETWASGEASRTLHSQVSHSFPAPLICICCHLSFPFFRSFGSNKELHRNLSASFREPHGEAHSEFAPKQQVWLVENEDAFISIPM